MARFELYREGETFDHWKQIGENMQEFIDSAERGHAPLDADNKRMDTILMLLYEIALELRSR